MGIYDWFFEVFSRIFGDWMWTFYICAEIILVIILFRIYYRRIKPYTVYEIDFIDPFWMNEIRGLIFTGIVTVPLLLFYNVAFRLKHSYHVVHLPIIAVTLYNFTVCAVNAGRSRKNQEKIGRVTIIVVNVLIAVSELILFIIWLLSFVHYYST